MTKLDKRRQGRHYHVLALGRATLHGPGSPGKEATAYRYAAEAATGRAHFVAKVYILSWRGALTVIDVPQAVDPRANPHAHDLLARDIANVAHYFGRFGVPSEPALLANRMWTRYQRAEL